MSTTATAPSENEQNLSDILNEVRRLNATIFELACANVTNARLTNENAALKQALAGPPAATSETPGTPVPAESNIPVEPVTAETDTA